MNPTRSRNHLLIAAAIQFIAALMQIVIIAVTDRPIAMNVFVLVFLSVLGGVNVLRALEWHRIAQRKDFR